MTSDNVSDGTVVSDFFEQLPADEVLKSFTGDGADDAKPVQESVIRRGAMPIIAPRKNARMRKSEVFVHRNAAIAACKRLGRDICKRWNGYHRRNLAEPG